MATTMESEAEVQQTPRRRGGLPRRVFLAVAATLSFLVALGSGAAIAVYRYADSQLVTISSDQTPNIGGPCAHDVCTTLILGSDSRAGLSRSQQVLFGSNKTVKGRRSDTIMLVQTDPSRRKAVILSFPRDLWVTIPGHGQGKINSAFGLGGPDLVAQTIERLTGIHVNHVVVVTLAGFEGVVDAMGGVPICVDRPLYDKLAGLNLPHAGCYDLTGFQALAFVRARHVCGDTIPDFSRIGRQQQFLRAVLAKILQPQMLLHLPSLVRSVFGNLIVDKGLDTGEIIHLTTLLKGVSTGAADFRAVPGVPAQIGPYSAVRLKEPDAGELFTRLRTRRPLGTIGQVLAGTQVSPANVTLRVFDASSGGVATNVSSYLTKAGFDIKPILAAGTRFPATSAIYYAPGKEDEAKVVAGYLPKLTVQAAPPGSMSEIEVAVVIAPGYSGAGSAGGVSGGGGGGGGSGGGSTSGCG